VNVKAKRSPCEQVKILILYNYFRSDIIRELKALPWRSATKPIDRQTPPHEIREPTHHEGLISSNLFDFWLTIYL
jgi:hypothetical protein